MPDRQLAETGSLAAGPALLAAPTPDAASQQERAILQRCQAGDWSGYHEIVERYQRLVRAAVDTGGGDDATSADLMQESFVRAFEKLHLYSFRSSFASWLYRLARNVALNHYRRERRRPVQLYAQESDLPPAAARQDFSAARPHAGYLDGARLQALRRMVALLPAAYHEPLALYYFHELSYEEIAAALAKPLNTVRTLLRRARLHLLEQARAAGWLTGDFDE